VKGKDSLESGSSKVRISGSYNWTISRASREKIVKKENWETDRGAKGIVSIKTKINGEAVSWEKNNHMKLFGPVKKLRSRPVSGLVSAYREETNPRRVRQSGAPSIPWRGSRTPSLEEKTWSGSGGRGSDPEACGG